MNSFQTPASNVAASLLVPPGQYTRVNGLQSFSGSAVTILAPALGSMFFAVIFVTLLAFIKIPDVKGSAGETPGAFFEKLYGGNPVSLEDSALLRIIPFLPLSTFSQN